MEDLLGASTEELSFSLDMGGYSKEKYRKDGGINQDAYFYDIDSGSAAVLDGLGGHEESEAASMLGSRLLARDLAEIPKTYNDVSTIQAFTDILTKINDDVLELARPNEDILPASTVCALKVFDDFDFYKAIVGHAGDTRASHIRNAEIIGQTIDHTYSPDTTGSQRLQMQTATSAAASFDELEGLAQLHAGNREMRKLKSCLGMTDTEFTLTTFSVLPGDTITLTSDGITGLGNLSTTEFLRCLEVPNNSAQNLAKTVVAKAFFRSLNKSHPRSQYDDLTCVVVKID